MEGAKTTLKRKLDENTVETTEVKAQKREIHVNFVVFVNGARFSEVRLVLNNDSTFEDVPPLLMPIITNKIKNLGENKSFECSVNGAILEKHRKISSAIDFTSKEVVEFSLTCDLKVNVNVFIDSNQVKAVALAITAEDSYFDLLKTLKESCENRGDVRIDRYRIDLMQSSISLNNVTQNKGSPILKTLPSANSVFVVKFVTQRIYWMDYLYSFMPKK